MALESDIVLRDGSTVYLRPLGADDADAVAAFFEGLSPESRRARFLGMASVPQATAQLLEACANGRGVLVGAELAGRLVAVAGYATDRSSESAQFSVAVADGLQGHGLGSEILERLGESARQRGIRTFTAETFAGNTSMLQVFVDSGLDVQQELHADVVHLTVVLEPTTEFEAHEQYRAQQAAAASMRGFFEPQSVAVIGASRRPGRIGWTILDNLRRGGFTGRIVAVNPHTKNIDGIDTYPTVEAIPGTIDLAVIVVPAELVEPVVDECVRKGIMRLVVISAGFGETGQAGRVREQALLRKVRAAGARLVGPNCLGLINTDPAIRLNATFAPTAPLRGPVALATQSGALGLALLDHAARLHLGVSTFVSVGNKADVSGNDLIQYWAEDSRTRVMMLYLESFGDPRQFGRIARRVGREKPIVVVKAGRSAAGARAAASHTGALATSDAVVDGLFRQAGVVRARTLEQFFDVATLLAHGSALPTGRRVGVLTNAGGPGILAADACEAHDLHLPPLAETTVEALRAFLPAAASVGNPVDMIASASPTAFAQTIAALAGDPGLDSLLVVYTPVIGSSPADVAHVIAEAARGIERPILMVWLSAGEIPGTLSTLPVFRFPEAAAEALASVTRYAEWRARDHGRVVAPTDIRSSEARAIVEQALGRGEGWLTPAEAQALVEAVGIAVARARAASIASEAAHIAGELGYPVVLKAVGPTIVHKTEVGGVALNLASADAVLRAYDDFAVRLGDALTGVLVQQQVEAGVELLAGIVTDPLFGPVVACGSGGILVSLIEDTVFRLHPLTDRDAVEMLDEMKGVRLLRGFRGAPPADEPAVQTVLLRLSALIDVCPEIQELDINPLIVHPNGARAVDVRARVGRRTPTTRTRRVRY